MALPSSIDELVAALRLLAERTPATRAELAQLEEESVFLALHIQKSQICSLVPEVVWHFLSDPDIRFKSPEYASTQLAALASALVALERHSAA